MADLEATLKAALRDGRLPCAFAFRIAEEKGVPPGEVGSTADRLGIRISRCQLGLFGYEVFGRKGFVTRLDDVPGDLTVSLRAASEEGAIPCAALWRIAAEHGLPRIAAACAAESLDLRIAPCQLGCF
jgi:hypothetical protein